jgi:hypothetical protein
MKKYLLVFGLITFLLWGTAVYGQEEEPINLVDDTLAEEELVDPGLLPNHPLYFLKSFSEGVGTLFTFGQVNRANRQVLLAENRLAEANALIAQGETEIAEKAMERYQEQFAHAFTFAQRAREAGQNTDEVMAKIAENTLRHQAVLSRVYEQVPEEARGAIEQAMESNLRGHQQALEAISQEAVGNGVGEILKRIEGKRPAVEERINQLQERGVPVPNLPERRQVPVIEEGLEGLEQEAPEAPAAQDQAESQVPVGTQNQIQEQAREQIPAVDRP